MLLLQSERAYIHLLICLGFYSHVILPVEMARYNALENEKPRIRSILNYRNVNWCITGKDEPELHLWPFNQFVPFLRRTHRFKHDEKNFRYDLRFYEVETTQRDLGFKGVLYKTVHVVLKAEQKRNASLGVKEQWMPLPLEGLLIQANHNPGGIGLPTGKFFAAYGGDIDCMDCLPHTWALSVPCRKRTNIAIEHTTVLAFHHLQRTYGTPIYLPDRNMPTVGKQPEIHSNFRWYSPTCSETRRLEFLVMAVRSFQNSEYDILTKGPYEVIIRDHKYQSDLYPSPYFTLYSRELLCHVRSSVDIQTEHPYPHKYHAMEMSSKFGCCTVAEENPKSSDTNDQIIAQYPDRQRSFSCQHLRNAKERNPLKILIGKESWQCYFPFPTRPCDTSDTERADLPYIACEPCPTLPSTTTQPPSTTLHSIYKRSSHGGMMIMTNFCLQPIVIYIARFYKETFNLTSFKGVKMWYWMHLIGGMISSGMIYFGYFSGAVTQRGFTHVVIGNVFILTLAFCYLTSWGRHKNSFINTCAEFFHGSLGYVTISLALGCVVTAPQVQFASKMLVYMMVGTQGLFMIIMTFHVCLLDRKFGMRPRRRHFPTVEARFDEVVVPRAKFRIIMLIIFSSITFSLSFTSTFFD